MNFQNKKKRHKVFTSLSFTTNYPQYHPVHVLPIYIYIYPLAIIETNQKFLTYFLPKKELLPNPGQSTPL